jgi:hypothetical protein
MGAPFGIELAANTYRAIFFILANLLFCNRMQDISVHISLSLTVFKKHIAGSG